MKVAFLSNKLTLRGTEIAMYDYAFYNRTLLGNESVIITRDIKKNSSLYDISQLVYDKFNKEFEMFYYETTEDIDNIIIEQKIDVLYIIKAGGKADGLITNKCKCVIHAALAGGDPHGDVYAAISEHTSVSMPIVYHMININDTNETMRNELNIPNNATVFGTYSGKECFNVQYMKDVVQTISNNPALSHIYFIFMNIEEFMLPNNNVIFLDGTSDMFVKRKFINTCDAMLYGRGCGETFGLSIGEFCLSKKPIICPATAPSRFHLDILGDSAITHNNFDELYYILTNWNYEFQNKICPEKYERFTPLKVMEQFKTVFLS